MFRHKIIWSVLLAFVLFGPAGAAAAGPRAPAKSTYAFQTAPLQAFDTLADLTKSSGLNLSSARDEIRLFRAARDGKLGPWSFAEAALIASGITDAKRRKPYLAKLDALEAKARKALAGARTPFEKGKKLLTFLHAGPMAKGYELKQSRLSTLLDTGKFNCVSSATLYNVLGRRLGLDVRAVVVPEHVFSVLYNGKKRTDVETTNPRGFNPSRVPLPTAQAKKRGGPVYIRESYPHDRREVGDLGLLALSYYNRGVELGKKKRYHEAVLANFRALSLDKENAAAARNILAELTTWGVALSRGGHYEKALNVVAVGLRLAPRDNTLLHNRKAFWTAYAEAALKDGKDREALTILRRAAKLVPDGGFEDVQADLYCRQGEPLARAGKWEQALQVAERGLAKVDAKPREALRKWRAELFLRWSAAERQAGNFEKAAVVLEKGLAVEPRANDLARAVSYLARQWAKAAAREGAKEATAVFQKMNKRFGGLAELKSAAGDFVCEVMRKPLGDGKYEEALAAVERYDPLFTDKSDAKKLAGMVYDAWSTAHRKKKDWQGAVDVYGKGLEKYPADGHLVNNLVATYDAWAQTFMSTGDWAGATRVYEKGLEQLPKNGHLSHNLNYCKKKMKQ